MLNPKNALCDIFMAGVRAVAPDQAILSHVHFDPQAQKLTAGDIAYDTGQGRLYVVGAGKGVAPMAEAMEKLLGDRLNKGFIVAKTGHDLPLARLESATASHPVPDKAGVEAASTILKMASELSPGDLLICLLTGGASALTTCPAWGLSLGDLQKTTSLLLGSGAEIGEINAIRKHLTAFGGGRLAQAANGANVLSLIVSDVIGDDLAAIASGPTAPDPTTFAQCLDIIKKYNIQNLLPPAVVNVLKQGAVGALPETPKPEAPFFAHVQNLMIATNAQAMAACAAKAAQLGLAPVTMPDSMRGEAALVAREIMAKAQKLQSAMNDHSQGICLIAGGETTVTLSPDAPAGGRNQEMALAAALAGNGKNGLYALFASTDGNDGPTDAAGGFALPDSLGKLGGATIASDALNGHAANAALNSSGDIFRTGPTLTNVMDLALVIIVPTKN